MRRARLITLLCVLSALGALVAAFGAAAATSTPSADPTQICGGSVRAGNNRYVVMNNVWGADSAQCIDVDDRTGAFRVARSDHDNGAKVAAYPAVFAGCHWGTCTTGSGMPARVDRISKATSSWSFSGADAVGTWNAAYDLWYHTTSDVNRSPDGAEVMIWLDRTAGARPGGTVVARNVSIAGATWDVWHARWAWNHVAYVRTSPTSSVSDLDLNAFTRDAVDRGYIDDSWYLSGIEAGFELRKDGDGLASHGFSARVNANWSARGGAER
jgi:hypothetical protein